MVKVGSKWSGTGNEKNIFRVIHVVELDDHTWIHYIKENAAEDLNREYSCYEESFLSRFRELPND
jgi:hypothetical protein